MAEKNIANACLRMAIVIAVANLVVFAATLLGIGGVVISENGVVGGDFLAFYTAGDAVADGAAVSMYDPEAFDAALKARAPLQHLGLLWQYPPAVFYAVAPLSLLPYKASFVLWMTAGWAALAGALRSVGFRGRDFWLLAASPLCVVVLPTGQASFLTGALLILASYGPGRRWLIAGAAAGLLTMKPQLGLLLPIAFVCAGAWRAFAVAAVTAILLHASTIPVFGLDAWTEFFAAVQRLNDDVAGVNAYAPPDGMTTLFSQLKLFGVPTSVAVGGQWVFAAVIAAVVGLSWRRTTDDLARAGVLCAGALLVTPYAYFYEMTALLLTAAYLGRFAVKDGRFTILGYCLGVCAAALLTRSLLPQGFPIQTPFLVCLSAFALATARIFEIPLPNFLNNRKKSAAA